MELDQALSKVRKLVEFAEAPIAPGATPEERVHAEREQKMAMARADKLMLDYAIAREQVRADMPAAERLKPEKLTIVLCDVGNPLKSQLAELAWEVCGFTRTKAVVYGLRAKVTKDLREMYEATGSKLPDCYVTIYGFKSDLAYFELIWTTLNLHLASGLFPEWDTSKSDGENAYLLHNAGYNWLAIAGMHPTNPWPQNGEGYMKSGSRVKRTYYKYIGANGLEPMIINASSPVTYRRNYSRAFTYRLRQRFAELRTGRQAGAALVLRSSRQEVNDLYVAENEKAREHSPDELAYNEQAWQRGKEYADSADLQGTRVSEPATKAVS